MRLRLDISYDGTHYQGWQKQAHTQATIQAHVEAALEKLFAQKIHSIGSGRTDAGVHARQQSLHFDLPDSIDLTRYRVLAALSSLLPADISPLALYLVAPHFHALASAEQKHYVYQFYQSAYPQALLDRYALHLHRPMDWSLWENYFQVLRGRQDFRSFQTAGTETRDSVREITELALQAEGQILQLHIKGDGFLKQMVRNMVGCLLDLSKESAPSQRLKEILAAKDRRAAGSTAAAKALFLWQVEYPSALILKTIDSNNLALK